MVRVLLATSLALISAVQVSHALVHYIGYNEFSGQWGPQCWATTYPKAMKPAGSQIPICTWDLIDRYSRTRRFIASPAYATPSAGGGENVCINLAPQLVAAGATSAYDPCVKVPHPQQPGVDMYERACDEARSPVEPEGSQEGYGCGCQFEAQDSISPWPRPAMGDDPVTTLSGYPWGRCVRMSVVDTEDSQTTMNPELCSHINQTIQVYTPGALCSNSSGPPIYIEDRTMGAKQVPTTGPAPVTVAPVASPAEIAACMANPNDCESLTNTSKPVTETVTPVNTTTWKPSTHIVINVNPWWDNTSAPPIAPPPSRARGFQETPKRPTKIAVRPMPLWLRELAGAQHGQVYYRPRGGVSYGLDTWWTYTNETDWTADWKTVGAEIPLDSRGKPFESPRATVSGAAGPCASGRCPSAPKGSYLKLARRPTAHAAQIDVRVQSPVTNVNTLAANTFCTDALPQAVSSLLTVAARDFGWTRDGSHYGSKVSPMQVDEFLAPEEAATYLSEDDFLKMPLNALMTQPGRWASNMSYIPDLEAVARAGPEMYQTLASPERQIKAKPEGTPMRDLVLPPTFPAPAATPIPFETSEADNITLPICEWCAKFECRECTTVNGFQYAYVMPLGGSWAKAAGRGLKIAAYIDERGYGYMGPDPVKSGSRAMPAEAYWARVADPTHGSVYIDGRTKPINITNEGETREYSEAARFHWGCPTKLLSYPVPYAGVKDQHMKTYTIYY